ncbi:MAG: DMT family transporter [Acidobacteria bacterium]|nr:DMT family transporter [Acidobacteriota bacterium]
MVGEQKAATVEIKEKSLTEIGELWALGGVLGYATANVLERTAVINADPLIGPLIRGIPSLILAVVLLITRQTYRQLQPGSKHYVGRRAIVAFIIPGVVSTAGLFTYFMALQKGGVAITIPVQQSFIVWGALFSWLYLGERFTSQSLMGVSLLVAGLVVLGLGQWRGIPVSSEWYYAIPLALFTAIAFGISGVFWREGQLRGADQSTGIFVQIVTSEITAFVGLSLFGRVQSLVEPSARDLAALVAGGVLSGVVGLYCMFTSLKLMSVTRAFALSSLTPLAAAILAFFFLREHVNWQMMIGIVMVCLGVALVQIFKPTEQEKDWKSE